MVIALVSCGKIGDKANKKIETQTEQVNNDDDANIVDNKTSENTDTKIKESEDVNKNDSLDKKEKEKGLSSEDGVSETDYGNHINDFLALRDSVNNNSKAIDNCYFCKYGTIAYIVYAIAIIILFIILRIIWMVATAKSPEAKKKENDEKQRLNKKIEELTWKISELNSLYDTLSMKVRNLNNEVTSIGNNIVREGSKVPESEGNTRDPRAGNITGIRNHLQTFYLRFPGLDGTFENSPVAKTEAYYRFELYEHNPDTARFTFMPGDATIMTRAMNNRSDYIEKACEPINTVEGKATTCSPVTEDYGQARLVNGKWEVTRKQKVRYE